MKDINKTAGSRNDDRSYEILLAEEALILDAQIAIQRVLNEGGFTQSQLADALGVSESYISQMLGDSARNLTLRTIARVMHVMGETALLTTRQRVRGFEEPVRPYECEADFGPWGEVLDLETSASSLNHRWLAEEWAANENAYSPAELVDAA